MRVHMAVLMVCLWGIAGGGAFGQDVKSVSTLRFEYEVALAELSGPTEALTEDEWPEVAE